MEYRAVEFHYNTNVSIIEITIFKCNLHFRYVGLPYYLKLNDVGIRNDLINNPNDGTLWNSRKLVKVYLFS